MEINTSRLNHTNMKSFLLPMLFVASVSVAQNLTSKSNEVALDFSTAKGGTSSIPKISWLTPESETSFLKEGKIKLTASIESRDAIKSAVINIREKDSPDLRGSSPLAITDDQKYSFRIDKQVTLQDGVNEIEIVVENEKGFKSIARRYVHVGSTLLADASKLNRTDYALIFATDKYDNWSQLKNPIFDSRTIANELQTGYGFKVDVVENATREEMFIKIREYAEKKYQPLDQLFIFIAGHGFYDDTFKEGFVVTKESLPSDPGRTSYVRHSELRSSINNNPCEHIFLVMDVCFGGTFDEDAGRGDNDANVYGQPSQSEIIMRKLQFKTRKYLTSGGKEYVSDGKEGSHSPFAKEFITALKSRGGEDGILTLNELMTYVEKLKTAPQFGKFGSDKQNSEFVFVVGGAKN
jgi:hypothetical protein